MFKVVINSLRYKVSSKS